MNTPAKGPIPSTLPNMVLALTVICAASALLLGGTYLITRPEIDKRRTEKQEAAIRAVLPPFDNRPLDDAAGPEATRIFRASLQGQPVGTAVMGYSDQGYARRIVTMTGFLPDGRIHAVAVLEQGETPGLGTRITAGAFLDQFAGQDPAGGRIGVRKDGGAIDAVAAATISSRAVCDAVNRSARVLRGGQP